MESSVDRVSIAVTNSDSESTDNNQWFILFNNSPYWDLNGVSLHVCNFNIESMSTLFSDEFKISFSIIQNVKEFIRDAMNKWCNSSMHTSADAELILRDSNDIEVKKYSLSEVTPINVSSGCPLHNSSLIEVSFTAVIHKSDNDNIISHCNDCNKLLNTDCIENAKVVVNLLDKVSEIKCIIDENDSLWYDSFMDALSNYEAFLQEECTEMLRSFIRDNDT